MAHAGGFASSSIGGASPSLARALEPRTRASQARAAPRRGTPAHAAAAPEGDARAAGGAAVPDALPVAGADADWRAFRARLVASSGAAPPAPATTRAAATPPPPPSGSGAGAGALDLGRGAWAHALAAPEPGALLLASPAHFADAQTYFSQAVILLIAAGPEGAAGLILNRPTERRVRDLPAADALLPELADAPLHLGGDVDPRATFYLHGAPGCAGAAELAPGVFLGGVEGLKAAVGAGRADAARGVKVLTRYAGWGPGQLEAELARGVWFAAAASREAALAPSAGANGGGAALWHAVLRLMGGDYAALAAAAASAGERGAGGAGAGAARRGADDEERPDAGAWNGAGI